MNRTCRLPIFLLLLHMLIPIGATGSVGSKPAILGKQPEVVAPRRSHQSKEAPQKSGLSVSLRNIPPLYTSPKMPGEGIWKPIHLSAGSNQPPIMYSTFYRPSSSFPNSIVYMVLFDMKRISMRLYLGSAEPYRKKSSSRIEDENQERLLAVTNALWQTRHAGKGGLILQGEVLKKPVSGVASLVVYKNESVDILEWNDQIPISDVQDVRQLKHLIVTDGKVVTSRLKRGKTVSAEIGLGSLLNEDRPTIKVPPKKQGKKPTYKLNLTSGNLWFIATRSAFGVREDGNLVFAVGHHISTCDLAKALVLAGCVRAIHGDANPGNAVGVIYYRNKTGKIIRKVRLSPLQHKCTVNRYLKRSYPKDFFAFFRRQPDQQ